jgi:hypothetical protein
MVALGSNPGPAPHGDCCPRSKGDEDILVVAAGLMKCKIEKKRDLLPPKPSYFPKNTIEVYSNNRLFYLRKLCAF